MSLTKIRNKIFRAVLVVYILQYKPGVECMLGVSGICKKRLNNQSNCSVKSTPTPKQCNEFVEKRERDTMPVTMSEALSPLKG